MIHIIKKITFCFLVGALLVLAPQVGHCAGDKDFETGTFQKEGSQDWITIGVFGGTTGTFYTPDGTACDWEATSSPIAVGSDHVMHYENTCHKKRTCSRFVSGTGVIRFSYDSANHQYVLKSIKGDDGKYHSKHGVIAYYKKVD